LSILRNLKETISFGLFIPKSLSPHFQAFATVTGLVTLMIGGQLEPIAFTLVQVSLHGHAISRKLLLLLLILIGPSENYM
jgi:hypothetical protein